MRHLSVIAFPPSGTGMQLDVAETQQKLDNVLISPCGKYSISSDCMEERTHYLRILLTPC